MMIQIEESKVTKMSEYAEEMLRAGGKLMQCIEELSSGEMGERSRYGNRGWRDDMNERRSGGYPGEMGERGRYMRY